MVYNVTHCTGQTSANTKPHLLHWVDQDFGTAIPCIEYTQMAGLIMNVISK